MTNACIAERIYASCSSWLLHCLWETLAGSCQRASYFLCGHSIHSLPIGTRIHKLQNPPKQFTHSLPLYIHKRSQTLEGVTQASISVVLMGRTTWGAYTMRKYLCQSSSTRETKAPCSHASRSLSEGIMLHLRGSSIKGALCKNQDFTFITVRLKVKSGEKSLLDHKTQGMRF